MNSITPEKIKELRERSGVGVSKCKEALVEADGDMQKAIEILRKAGLASSVKKESRETKEGAIFACQSAKNLAMIEINSETDFVAKNEKFVEFGKNLCEQLCQTAPASLEAFMTEKYKKDPSVTVDGYRNLLIQQTGENIQIKRFEVVNKAADASYGIYSHMHGKLLTVVEIKGSSKEEALAYEVAMHVAAEDPQYLKSEEVPENVKKKEEEIARSQLKGKPENVIGKILEGKLRAYFEQVCLIMQKFVKDNSITVQQYVENHGKKVGQSLHVSCFWRWKVGE